MFIKIHFCTHLILFINIWYRGWGLWEPGLPGTQWTRQHCTWLRFPTKSWPTLWSKLWCSSPPPSYSLPTCLTSKWLLSPSLLQLLPWAGFYSLLDIPTAPYTELLALHLVYLFRWSPWQPTPGSPCTPTPWSSACHLWLWQSCQQLILECEFKLFQNKNAHSFCQN